MAAERLHVPCMVLIGEQALLHDLNTLALVTGVSVPVYAVVTSDHSGAIFL